MSTIREIVTAAESLGADDFLKLRTQLDHVEERIWKHELEAVSAKHRKAKLTDAKIDELAANRRRRGRS